ncbi:hypothetical protein ELS24_13760 [Achromobacter spanius]|uniref:hypothetical protein n=1 Tax=Achromobacter spanius TaxID=217203 RepID=UPI000F8F9517|nr:hypothetical protein [Achromobacter spanius]AZS79423.1 hypothetical protein ELS24_13760 [Achromobacter spanius]
MLRFLQKRSLEYGGIGWADGFSHFQGDNRIRASHAFRHSSQFAVGGVAFSFAAAVDGLTAILGGQIDGYFTTISTPEARSVSAMKTYKDG